jgi:hypothetical protein
MGKILEFVAAHEVGIGLLGTLLVVLAVFVGIRRADRAALDDQAAPPGKTHP